MEIEELARSGRPWPHPVPSPDGLVLGPEGLNLPMPEQPNPYLALMARFVDGPEHAARRRAVLVAMPPVEGLEEIAYQRAVALAGERVDVVPVAKSVPVAVLGEVLGVGDLSAEIGELCERGTVPAGLPDVPRASLLFQCRDATAALILNALADGAPVEDATSVVLTRRAGGRWVLLDGVPFGAGAHACPGREQALALARGVVRAFESYEVVERGPHEARPNIRMPARLVMRRRH
jgi:cytochrome P450